MATRFSLNDYLIIDTNGYVGISVPTPVARLQISGSGTTSSTYGLLVYNSAATIGFTVRDDGNVGIGTTSPTNKLSVNGTTAITGTLLPGAANSYALGSTSALWHTIYGTYITASYITGSLTKLSTGQSYLVAGSNITITSQSNGQVLITADTQSGTGADSQASYLVMSATASLPNERVLTAGSGISITDGGAGNNAVVTAILTSSLNTFTTVGPHYLSPARDQIAMYATATSTGSIFLPESAIAGDTVVVKRTWGAGSVIVATTGSWMIEALVAALTMSLDVNQINSDGNNNFQTLVFRASGSSWNIQNYFDVGCLSGAAKKIWSKNISSVSPSDGQVLSYDATANSWLSTHKLTGSLTKLSDGTSYIRAGTNVTVVTGSNGAITISATSLGGGDPDPSYLTLAATASLTNERVFTPGTGLTATDAGAGGAYTLAINNGVVATVSGTTFTGATLHSAGLSGSLTKLTNGTSYLIAGSNITITTGSSGAVTIASSGGGGDTNATYVTTISTGSLPNSRVLTAGNGITITDNAPPTQTVVIAAHAWTDGGAKLKTTSSVSIDPNNAYASAYGTDIYFYVSGTIGDAGAGTKRAAFAGDVRISGSLTVGTGSIIITSNDITFSTASIKLERSGGNLKMHDENVTPGVTLSFIPHRRTALDSNHVEGWLMNEAALPFVSSVGSLDLSSTSGSGGVQYQAPGIVHRNAVHMSTGSTGSRLFFSTGSVSAGLSGATSATVDAWVKFTVNDNYSAVFRKAYRNRGTGGWSSPWLGGLGLMIHDSGQLVYDVVRGGAISQGAIGSTGMIPRGIWTHVGLTYNEDDGKIHAWVNGICVGVADLSDGDPLDWGDADGEMYVGGVDYATLQTIYRGCIQDVRISNIARPASYFEAIYRAGTGTGTSD